MGLCDFGTEDLEYQDDRSPEENVALALYAMARRLHNLADSVEAIGFNGASRGGGEDPRGCLEKLASDLPEALDKLADRTGEG